MFGLSCANGGPLPNLPGSCRLVLTVVDVTITRTDVLGHILPRVGLDWSHAGITRLFSHIRENGYDILFLSSRAIAQVLLHALLFGGAQRAYICLCLCLFPSIIKIFT